MQPSGIGLKENDPVQAGDRVVAMACQNYPGLTGGREYVVREYVPYSVHPTFTFPPYIRVVGDNGKSVLAHVHRFRRAASEP